MFRLIANFVQIGEIKDVLRKGVIEFRFRATKLILQISGAVMLFVKTDSVKAILC
jgi:hypothetical protein